MTVNQWKDQLLKEKETLRVYLISKFESEDYHAVQDAASDIREIDAMLKVLNTYDLSKM